MGTQQIVEHAAALALVFSRLAGFIIVSPFPGKWVMPQMRVAIIFALAVPLSISLKAPHARLGINSDLPLAAGTDFLVGVLIGASFYLVLSAAEFMAGMVSQASWLSAPISMNPATGGQSQVLAQVASLLALLLALAVGVHRVVLGYLLESFHVLPIGEPVAIRAALPGLIYLAGRSFDIGMRLSIPVFAVSLAVQAALALVARVAPSLQIFNVGFGVLVATGLVTFAASLRSVSVGILQYASTLGPFIDRLLLKLMGA